MTDLVKKPSITELEIRQKVAALEEAVGQLPQGEFPLKHSFAPGVYLREIHIPAGSVIVGKIHRHAHFNFISSGHVTVLTKDGLQELHGPCTMVSSAGTKRALYAHTDVVWSTIHANPDEDRDIEVLEHKIIAPSYEALEHEQKKFLESVL